VHRVEVKRMEERSGRMAHRRRRIQPGKLADGRRLGEKFHDLAMLCEELEKGVEEGALGGFYRWTCMEEGLGF
jgi:hypothetical protein